MKIIYFSVTKYFFFRITSSSPGLLSIDEQRTYVLFHKNNTVPMGESIGEYRELKLQQNRKHSADVARRVKSEKGLRRGSLNSTALIASMEEGKNPKRRKTSTLSKKFSLEGHFFKSASVEKRSPPKSAESSVIKKYKRIGSGATSKVYSCSVNGWICAMKEVEIKKEDLTHPQNISKEIEVLNALPKHENLIQFMSYKRTEETFQIFLQQYHSSLDEIIAQRKANNNPFTPIEIVTILCDVISGLLMLHTNNIIHRGKFILIIILIFHYLYIYIIIILDIKSQNIFIEEVEYPQPRNIYIIGDFDSATFFSKSNPPTDTVGTPAFMAPEIINSNNESIYNVSADGRFLKHYL